jgi:hypothetical protein
MEHYGTITGRRHPKYPTWITMGFKLNLISEKLADCLSYDVTRSNVLSRVYVTIDAVWIGNWIY